MSQPPDFTKPPEQATPPPPGGYAAAPPPGYAPAPPPGGYAAAPPPNQAYGTPPPGGYPAAPPPSHAYATPGLPPLPPGTELASAGRRIGTYLVDVVLLVVTLFIGYLIWMLIVWARGQTPGKQVMGLRVYHLQNQRAASWGQMFLRQVVGGIVNSVFFSIGLIVSVVFLFTDPLRRTVPDRIAGTIVLSDPNKVLEPR